MYEANFRHLPCLHQHNGVTEALQLRNGQNEKRLQAGSTSKQPCSGSAGCVGRHRRLSAQAACGGGAQPAKGWRRAPRCPTAGSCAAAGLPEAPACTCCCCARGLSAELATAVGKRAAACEHSEAAAPNSLQTAEALCCNSVQEGLFSSTSSLHQRLLKA